MKNHIRSAPAKGSAFCAILLAFLACSPLRASVLLSYDASLATPDPTTQGWTKNQGTSPAVSASAGTVKGVPVWSISDTVNGDGLGHTFYYQQNLTAQQDAELAASGWSLSTTVSVSGNASYNNSNSNLTFISRYAVDGTLLTGKSTYYTLYVGALNGQLRFSLLGYNSQALLYTATTTDPVTVELRLNPGADALSVYANGTLIVDDYVGFVINSTPTMNVQWGDGGGPDNRTSNWASVNLEAIPEPSAPVLLMPGLGIAFAAYRFQRRGFSA